MHHCTINGCLLDFYLRWLAWMHERICDSYDVGRLQPFLQARADVERAPLGTCLVWHVGAGFLANFSS